jgi:hypothetical protein
MKFNIKEIIIALLSAVILFFLSQYLYPWFFEMAAPKVEGAYFNVTSFESPFKLALKFSLIWAAVPIICLLVWKLIPDISTPKKIAVIILLFGGILSAIYIRRFLLQKELEDLVVSLRNVPGNSQIVKALENINFEYWMTVGLVSGTILCFILFRKKRRKWMK